MKQFSFLLVWFCWTLSPGFSQPGHWGHYPDDDMEEMPRLPEPQTDLIQVALLLDVSGSMDGLLEQAKSQLWFMVNGIMADHPYHLPRIEVAVYEYGRNSLGYRSGYARQLLPFTSDLDWVAETLYGLRTGGSMEYCGVVIDRAVAELAWSPRPHDQRMIFIAGNESFSQGRISYRDAIEQARWSGIQVHTLFCGEYDAGVRYGWLQAAELGQGVFALIDQQAPHHHHPVSGNHHRWVQLNSQLNATYLPYGQQGRIAQQRQQQQDQMVAQYGSAYVAARTRTKASAAYQNPHWDLIDAISTGQVRLAEVPESQLPVSLRGRSLAHKQQIIARQQAERNRIRQEIAQLQAQDQQVGLPSVSNRPASRPQRLDEAVVQATRTPVAKPNRVPAGKPMQSGRVDPAPQSYRPVSGSPRATPARNLQSADQSPVLNRGSIPTEVQPAPTRGGQPARQRTIDRSTAVSAREKQQFQPHSPASHKQPSTTRRPIRRQPIPDSGKK